MSGKGLFHTWSSSHRKSNHSSTTTSSPTVLLPFGGLVPADALQAVNDKHPPIGPAVRASRKLSIRTGFRRPFTLTLSPADRLLEEPSLDTPGETQQLSSPSTPTSKSTFDSDISQSSTSTAPTLTSPITANRPLISKRTRSASPDLPQVPELTGCLPYDDFLEIPQSPFVRGSRLTRCRSAMGQLIIEIESAKMEKLDIESPNPNTIASEDTKSHRRFNSESSITPRTDLPSPTPLPLFAGNKSIVGVMEGSNSTDQAGQQGLDVSPRRASASAVQPVRPPLRTGSPESDTLIAPVADSAMADRNVETEAMRVERDYFRKALQDAQANLELIMTRLSKSQIEQRLLKDQKNQLEGRLEDANVQRVDACEHNLFLEEKLKQIISEGKSNDEGSPTIFEPNAVGSELLKAEERIEALEEELAVTKRQSNLSPIVAALSEQVNQLQLSIKAKDGYIQTLERRNNNQTLHMDNLRQQYEAVVKKNETLKSLETARTSTTHVNATSLAQSRLLEARLKEQETATRSALARKEQLTQLLHAEVRRQAAADNNLEHPNSAQLETMPDTDGILAEIRARVSRHMAKNGEMFRGLTPDQRIRRLEKEIEYHVKDIVLYKLDVKGYKKDLRRANSKIKQLSEGVPAQQITSPMSPSPCPSLTSNNTTSTPNSAFPTTPSVTQGAYAALAGAVLQDPNPQQGPSGLGLTAPLPTPPLPVTQSLSQQLATAATIDPRAPSPARTVSTESVTRSVKQRKRDTSPPHPSPFQQFAATTPSTPTTPSTINTVTTASIAASLRHRSLNSPPRNTDAPAPPVDAPPAPPIPATTQSDTDGPPKADDVVEQKLGVTSPGLAELSTDPRTPNETVEGAKGEAPQPRAPPPRSAMRPGDRSKPNASVRDSAQGWPEVPGGGLPPLMWGKGKGKVQA